MNSPKLSKSPTNCITFRIPTEKLKLLHKESEAKQISLNTLVHQIIREDIEWHSLAPHAKLYYLPKSFLMRVVNELKEEELNELARETAKQDLVDISLYLRGGFSIASLSNFTETWLKIARMPYRFEINGVICKVVIEHDMGYKYSYLIKEISKYLLDVAFEAKSSCSITDNTVTIDLKK